MGTRETQRREWREAVARAAEALADETLGGWFTFKGKRCRWRRGDGMNRLDAALSAPKPWTRPAKADLGRDTRRMKLLREDSITLLHLDGTVRGFWRSKAYFALCARLRRKRRAAQRRGR